MRELLHFALFQYALEKLLHFALTFLLHFASMLLHFALVLHFAAILITFCINITFCGDYYILRRNSDIEHRWQYKIHNLQCDYSNWATWRKSVYLTNQNVT